MNVEFKIYKNAQCAELHNQDMCKYSASALQCYVHDEKAHAHTCTLESVHGDKVELKKMATAFYGHIS